MAPGDDSKTSTARETNPRFDCLVCGCVARTQKEKRSAHKGREKRSRGRAVASLCSIQAGRDSREQNLGKVCDDNHNCGALTLFRRGRHLAAQEKEPRPETDSSYPDSLAASRSKLGRDLINRAIDVRAAPTGHTVDVSGLVHDDVSERKTSVRHIEVVQHYLLPRPLEVGINSKTEP